MVNMENVAVPKKKSKGVLIGSIVAVFLCAAVLTFFLLSLTGHKGNGSGGTENPVVDEKPATVADFQNVQTAREERAKYINKIIALAFNWESAEEYNANRNDLLEMGVPEDSQLMREYMPELTEDQWIDDNNVKAHTPVLPLEQTLEELFPNAHPASCVFVESMRDSIQFPCNYELAYSSPQDTFLWGSGPSSNIVMFTGGVDYRKSNGDHTDNVGFSADLMFEFKDSTSLELKDVRVIPSRVKDAQGKE